MSDFNKIDSHELDKYITAEQPIGEDEGGGLHDCGNCKYSKEWLCDYPYVGNQILTIEGLRPNRTTISSIALNAFPKDLVNPKINIEGGS